MQRRTPSWRAPLAVPLLAISAGACNEDPALPEYHADDVAEIRLAVGAQAVRIVDGVPDAPITIGPGQTAVAATFHDASGTEVDVGAGFRLELAVALAGIATFEAIGPFGGALSAVSAGTTTAQVSLFHIGDGHADVGPWTVTITVQ